MATKTRHTPFSRRSSRVPRKNAVSGRRTGASSAARCSAAGRLVGDQRQEPDRAALRDQVVDDLLGRHHGRAKAAAHRRELEVAACATRGLVGRDQRHAEGRRAAQQQPLPVAVMRGEQQDPLAAAEASSTHAFILEAQAPDELVLRDPRAMHGLGDQFSEVAVELTGDPSRARPRWRPAGTAPGPTNVVATPADDARKEGGCAEDHVEPGQRQDRKDS